MELPGKTGIVSIDFITGLTFTDELKDLYATLQANGIEVYIVSASPIDTVLAANETMGYNLPEDHVYAMRNKLGEDGRYINEYNYDWGGEGKYAQTQGEGKSTIITNFIAPQYDNAGPLMVFGDTESPAPRRHSTTSPQPCRVTRRCAVASGAERISLAMIFLHLPCAASATDSLPWSQPTSAATQPGRT